MSKRISYTLQYVFKAKAEFLFNYLLTADSLSGWFADDVKVEGDFYFFSWDKSIEKAKLIKQTFKKKLVYQWIERPSHEYLTFLLDHDELTGETTLTIIDYDFEDQLDSARLIWNTAIENLKKLVGG